MQYGMTAFIIVALSFDTLDFDVFTNQATPQTA